MKLYFDRLDNNDSNVSELEKGPNTDYWLVAPGAPIKKTVMEMNLPVDTLDKIDDVGVYIVDVRGDPNWWAGVLTQHDVPTRHIISCLPERILSLVRNKKIRLVIAADREGGPMITQDWDCFRTTYSAIKEAHLPTNSVLITHGNRKIEKQYNKWLLDNSVDRIYDVMYSNHFGNIFLDGNIPNTPIINESIVIDGKDFNSLNRVYRPQRGAHLYRCIVDGILDNGLISGNQIKLNDEVTELLCEGKYDIISKHFPKFIDGDWSNTNAANQYNVDIYRNSLMTVITETMFEHDVAFITEKIFKPITLGHPLILFASQGTLENLREMGFRTDWCGIDSAYNDIEDPIQRFKATQAELLSWVRLTRKDKIQRIKDSMNTIEHNFHVIRNRDFYKEAILEIMNRSKVYFNETI